MSPGKPSLQELREKVGAILDTHRLRSSFSLLADGFPQRALIEVSGFGKTELITHFLKEHPDFKTAWIEPQITINPYALFQRGLPLEQILFIEARDHLQWCLSQALQSG